MKITDHTPAVIDGIKKTVELETKRTYIFPNGEVSFENVTEIITRPSGSHRLTTADGKLHYVTAGWLAMTFEAPHWEI